MIRAARHDLLPAEIFLGPVKERFSEFIIAISKQEGVY